MEKAKNTALYRSGIQAIDELRWKDAEQFFGALLRVDPENHESLAQLSLLYAKKKQFRKAEKTAFRATELARNALTLRAIKKGWKDQSFRSYLRALRSFALVQYQSQKRRESLAAMQELHRLDPGDHLGISFFLQAFLKGKKWKEMEGMH